MNRMNLLDRAVAEGGLDSATKKLALAYNSTTAIEARVMSLKRHIETSRAVCRAGGALVMVAVGCFILSGASLLVLDGTGLIVSYSAAAFLGLGFLYSILLLIPMGLEAKAKVLAPVVNSESCLRAAKLLETNAPDVKAWRDLVIAERDVLAEFDLEIMSALVYAADIAQRRAEREAEVQAACKKVYGIREDLISA